MMRAGGVLSVIEEFRSFIDLSIRGRPGGRHRGVGFGVS